jgi:hypothetical protein
MAREPLERRRLAGLEKLELVLALPSAVSIRLTLEIRENHARLPPPAHNENPPGGEGSVTHQIHVGTKDPLRARSGSEGALQLRALAVCG